MTQAQQSFIEQIAPLLQRYAVLNGYHIEVVPAMIAQACLESFYNGGLSSLAAKYHNYWGMKCGTSWTGKSVNMSTKEEYTTGTLTSIRDNFRVYANMEEGVKGYFQFLGYSNYRPCRDARTPEVFIYYLKAGGWATSSTYVTSLISRLDTLGVRKYGVEIQEEEIEPYAGIVTASALRVRTGAGTGYPIMQVGGHDLLLPNNMVVAICGERDGFGRLSDIGGWVSLSYISH